MNMKDIDRIAITFLCYHLTVLNGSDRKEFNVGRDENGYRINNETVLDYTA